MKRVGPILAWSVQVRQLFATSSTLKLDFTGCESQLVIRHDGVPATVEGHEHKIRQHHTAATIHSSQSRLHPQTPGLSLV